MTKPEVARKTKTDAGTISGPGFTRVLLRWFQKNKRDLPWRSNPTPYRVWISEIMLQQTVLQTMIPYFNRWMRLFPDINRLAHADQSKVLRSWEGLGYYTRARNLHKTARILNERWDGEVPSEYEKLKLFPGIGEYTAAAIASIAYGKPHPVIDANVRRVAMRLFGWRTWNKIREKQLHKKLTSLISRRRPGDFNEALMELGQTICRKATPKCEDCPISKYCRFYNFTSRPVKSAKRKPEIVRKKSRLLIFISGKKILMKQVTENLFAGLWVFPTLELRNGKRKQSAVEWDSPFNSKLPIEANLPSRVHHYTRFAERLYPVVCEFKRSQLKTGEGWQWVALKDLENFPVPSTYRKIINDLRNWLTS